jgi:hypothetical protein
MPPGGSSSLIRVVDKNCDRLPVAAGALAERGQAELIDRGVARSFHSTNRARQVVKALCEMKRSYDGLVSGAWCSGETLSAIWYADRCATSHSVFWDGGFVR